MKKYLLGLLKKIENVDFEPEKEIIIIDYFSTDVTKERYKNISHKIFKYRFFK